MQLTSGTAGTARSGRAVVTVVFALNGAIFAQWVSRIPDIKDQVGSGTGPLGAALLCAALGSLATMPIAGRVCARLGSPPVTLVTALLTAAVLVPLGRAPNVYVLGGVLLLYGAAFGALDVAMNTDAVGVVHRLARPVMPSFHAAFSIGGLGGAVCGGLLAKAGLSPGTHFAITAAAAVAVALACARPLLALPRTRPDDAGEDAAGGTDPATRRRILLALGVIAFCSAYGEGALADWSALLLREHLGAGPALAAAGFAAFSLTMTVGRLAGERVLARWGSDRVLTACGVVAAAGMLLAVAGGSVPVALLGFALVGAGLCFGFPVTLQAAGDVAGSPGIASVSTVGYTGFLLGPPLIGWAAEGVGLPTALASVAVLALLSAAVSAVLRPADHPAVR